MIDFFRKLFDTSDFPARWNCGMWTSGHGWLHILSDIGVWGAYTTIPIVLAYFVLRRKDVPFPRIFILFALFIFACGTTHLIESIIFWWPIYRVSGLAKLGTAVVSWATVLALIPITPKALALPGLAKVNEQLQKEIGEKEAAERALRESESRLRTVIQTAGEGIVSVNEKGEILTFNPAAEQIFGVSAMECGERSIGALIRDISMLPRDGDARGPGGDGQPRLNEGVGTRNDGSDFPVEYIVSSTSHNGQKMFIITLRDITERKRMEERQHLLMGELSHRVKNTLATVQSIATQTMQFSDSFDTFRTAFEGRLRALAQAHGLLTGAEWEGAELRDIVLRELQPHGAGSEDRITVTGPNVSLRPKAALALHMVFHELTTNAAKYGALSTDQGRVQIQWELHPADGSQSLRIRWSESGGPPVATPTRRGFGSQVMEAAIAYELGGEATIRYEGSGVVAEIGLPWADQIGYVSAQPQVRRTRKSRA